MLAHSDEQRRFRLQCSSSLCSTRSIGLDACDYPPYTHTAHRQPTQTVCVHLRLLSARPRRRNIFHWLRTGCLSMLYAVCQLLLPSLLLLLAVCHGCVAGFDTKAPRILMIASIRRPNEIKQTIRSVLEYEPFTDHLGHARRAEIYQGNAIGKSAVMGYNACHTNKMSALARHAATSGAVCGSRCLHAEDTRVFTRIASSASAIRRASTPVAPHTGRRADFRKSGEVAAARAR